MPVNDCLRSAFTHQYGEHRHCAPPRPDVAYVLTRAAGNYSRHVAALPATDTIFYTIKSQSGTNPREPVRHTADNIGLVLFIRAEEEGDRAYRSNKRRHVGSGENNRYRG